MTGGYTLWVTYHLEWGGLGSPANDITNVCGDADKDFTVTATITEVGGGGPLGECTAGASGYSKK